MWAELLSMVPPFIENVAHSLCNLSQGIETLSTQAVLHPSKCRCLATSYSKLISHVLILIPSSSSSPSLQLKLPALLTALLDTLREGERFIKGCQYYQGWMQWLIPVSKQHQWLINTALPIALSTEIFDVHLHDLVWCISTLIWVLTDSAQDIRIQAEIVDALLKETWALANEEDDVKSMQELFNQIGAEGHRKICNLICNRLSESTSRAKLNLTDAVVPAYLWMDPQNFEKMVNDAGVLSSSESVRVFETRLMGGSFARKHFYRRGDEEVFKNEAVIQARLRHANVVHLVCCTMKANNLNLVMELMHQDLGSLISKRRSAGMDAPFSLLAGIDLMLQIAKGMEYLHDLGIMHRDLKSFNILVRDSQHASHSDERGHVNAKIADFGTSKAKHNTSMYTTKRVGTSIWRAPEVLDDDDAKYTKKADVYSFAIVCSEIMTGLPPDELLPCNLRSELPKLLREGRRPKLPSGCPPAIASYIEKCWHGDASERPTFKQICTVFRFFKACILLRDSEMLALPLDDDMFDFEELQRTAVERQSEGMFYHPVLNIPSEMHVFETLRKMEEQTVQEKRRGIRGRNCRYLAKIPQCEPQTIEVLLQRLSLGEPDVQRAAAGELRMLSKRNPENCVCIAEAGAIPHLVELLSCQDPHTQEHVVTTLVNLSRYEGNKGTVITCGAVNPIVEVLKSGSMKARENAAATLSSLSVGDENNEIIGVSGAIPALIKLLCDGTLRGKRDAARALYNLCIYQGNRARVVRAHVIPSLMLLLRDPFSDMVDKALAILAILATHQEGRAAITQASAIPILVELIQSGSLQNKGNAAAVLVNLCSNDPLQLALVKELGAYGPLSELARTGTVIARRKAFSLLDDMNELEKNTSDMV